MGRIAGTPNKGRAVEHQLLKHGKRQWRYSGKLYADHLDINKIDGEITGHVAELDAAIKRECTRLHLPVHLNDPVAADLMLKCVAVVP